MEERRGSHPNFDQDRHNALGYGGSKHPGISSEKKKTASCARTLTLFTLLLTLSRNRKYESEQHLRIRSC